MIVLFLVESSGTSTAWRCPSSTLTQAMVLPRQPREPWAQCWTPSAVYSWESMIAFQWWSRQKIHPEKKNGPHSQETSESGFDLHYMKYVVPPPRNLTYIQVPKIAIFERRIHFLQGPWFLGYISKLNFGHVFCIPFNTFFHSGFRSLKKEQVSRCFHWATLRLGRSKSYVSNIKKNGNDLGGTNHQVTCLLGFWFIFTFPCCWEWWISKCIIGKNATTKW